MSDFLDALHIFLPVVALAVSCYAAGHSSGFYAGQIYGRRKAERDHALLGRSGAKPSAADTFSKQNIATGGKP